MASWKSAFPDLAASWDFDSLSSLSRTSFWVSLSRRRVEHEHGGVSNRFEGVDDQTCRGVGAFHTGTDQDAIRLRHCIPNLAVLP